MGDHSKKISHEDFKEINYNEPKSTVEDQIRETIRNEVGEKLDKIGISVFKVAMPWPLDTRDLTKWAKGFSKILVLEEKRNLPLPG